MAEYKDGAGQFAGDSGKYKALASAKNVRTASLPVRHEAIGSNPWDFGGGRLQVSEYTPEELGPREMTKFDPKNKYHTAMLKSAGEKDETTEGLLVHSGGSFSFPKKEQKSEEPQKKQRKGREKKAVADKKVSNLEKARATETAAKKSGKL